MSELEKSTVERGTEIGSKIGYGNGCRTCVCVYMMCTPVQHKTSVMGFKCNQLLV